VVRGFCGSPDRAETIVTDIPDDFDDGFDDGFDDEIPSTIHLPPLPALTTLVIELHLSGLLPHFANTLCSIGSAPALESIVIDYPNWGHIDGIFSEDPWVDLDRWLSRIARHAEVAGGLTLTLRRWPEGKSIWEGFLPKFRESGEIKVEH